MDKREGFLKRFREVFGENRKTAWKRLAEELGGVYEEGGLVKVHQVRFRYKQWDIEMDTASERRGQAQRTFTRIAAGFVKKTDFHFGISGQTRMSQVFEYLGAQDILVGIPEFDDQFIVKGEDERMVRMLLRDEKLRGLIQSMGEATFFVSGRGGVWHKAYNDEIHEVIFSHKGVVTDVDYLKRMFSMVAHTLDLLVEHGIASEVPVIRAVHDAAP